MKTSEFKTVVEQYGMTLTVNKDKANVIFGGKAILKIADNELFVTSVKNVPANLLSAATSYAQTPEAERVGSDTFKLRMEFLTADDNRNFVMARTEPRVIPDKDVKKYKSLFTRLEIDEMKKIYNLASFTEVSA